MRWVLLLSLAGLLALAAYGAPFVGAAWDVPESRARLVAAVLGVMGTALTALGAFALWSMQHSADRRREQDRRRDRRHRLLVALRAELGLNLVAQEAQFGPAQTQARKPLYLAELEKAGRGEVSMPMAVVSQTNDVFDAIKSEIADLPEEVIAPVIAYYQQDEYVSQLLTRFAEGRFESVSKERRKRAIDALFTVGASALEAALAAFDAVNRELEAQGTLRSETARKMKQDAERIRTELARNGDAEAQGRTASDDNDRGA
ncbi:hypothetical protein ACFORG_21960 [Lutimaribacter marinistellae]|uniref:Uncharacterized protein n=1 Tax=Lutimaribacter marinistellae TaxID=1820329 RepID=A0ABV7TLA8_9RHOB